MAIELRPQLKQTVQLRMTPQLRQAIKILQLARTELDTVVAEEVCQNPVLEEATGETVAQSTRTGDPESTETEKPADGATENEADTADLREVDWQEYYERSGGDFHGSIGAGSDRDDNRARLFENARAPEGGLVEALVDQLGMLMMSEDERRIATLIIHNLDDSGFLECTPQELAFIGSCGEEEALEAREIVQELEPPGCGSIDLRDCLLVQLRLIGYEPDDYVVLTVEDHLKDLEAQNYDRIARALKASKDEILEAHRIIRTLDPKPGRQLSDTEVRYITPDAYIVRVGNDFEVILNEDGLPNLHVSPYYRSMLAQGKKGGEAIDYLQDKVRSAEWLIRAIVQRQRTLRKVVESILGFQRDFFLHGVDHLRPLVLKDVANEIEMHESTVSRATSNKYVHTPLGLVPLKYFFTSSLRAADGSDISSEVVKQKIQAMIARENRRKPHSDQYVSQRLAEEGIDIARRTVAKYRENMGILPSSKRKKVAALD